MSIIKLARNATTAKLFDASREVKLIVSSLLSYTVEGFEHMAAFKGGSWDGRSSFFEFKSGTFPAGFVHAVHTKLVQSGYEVQLVRKPLPAPLGPENPKVDDYPEDPNYDYQPETVRRLLKYGQMIARVATGGGKSRIAKLAYARINRPTLFLTTRSVLMYQMRDAFVNDMGIKVGVIGDGNMAPVRGMNVGMVQSIAPYVKPLSMGDEIQRMLEVQANNEKKRIEALKVRLKKRKASLKEISDKMAVLREELKSNRLSDEEIAQKAQRRTDEHNKKHRKVIKLLEFFEFVILEEAHESSGDGYYDTLNACKNAHYRLSLTATPFMRDDEANMRLMAVSGPVGIHISEKKLIDLGILATPYFKYVKVQKPAKLYRTTPWQRAYKVGIVESQYRNQAIAYEARRVVSYGMTAMILINHSAHGKALKAILSAQGVRTEFIWGKHEQRQRKDALARLLGGEIDVLIGSSILDVGVDVPAVGMVILAGGGKAETALRQRVGRGLRRKKVGPNVCLVVDFEDDTNTHLMTHAKERRGIIEKTPGFAENILPAGADFDFEKLGLAA